MTSEHTYRRVAKTGLWEGAQQALDEFNARYTEIHHLLTGPTADTQANVDATDTLLAQFAFRHNGTAPTFDGPFSNWMAYCFYPQDIKNPDLVRPKGEMIIEVIDGKREATDFLEALEVYRNAIDDVVQSVAPEHFTYQGFKMWNPERLGEAMCRRLFEGVDYVVALFKRRGVEPLLREGLKQVELLPKPSMENLDSTALGLYITNSKTIILSTQLVSLGRGRFMKWINEAFLHEFGHHVHLSYLPPAARAEWDAGWKEVKDKQEVLQHAFKSITAEDRAKFFDVLVATKFEPNLAVKRLEPVAKVKFGIWLRTPMMGDPLITPKQFRWTKPGRELENFYTDRPSYMRTHYEWIPEGSPEYERQVDLVDKRWKDKLALLWDGKMSIPQNTVLELSKSNPVMQQAVEEAIAKLEIVSDYGKRNEKEDFAETFVAFMDAPEHLTPTAKFRMQRTLSLANFYNKPVVRLAEKDSVTQRIVDRYLHAHRQ
jgi:hypothetical protein